MSKFDFFFFKIKQYLKRIRKLVKSLKQAENKPFIQNNMNKQAVPWKAHKVAGYINLNIRYICTYKRKRKRKRRSEQEIQAPLQNQTGNESQKFCLARVYCLGKYYIWIFARKCGWGCIMHSPCCCCPGQWAVSGCSCAPGRSWADRHRRIVRHVPS